MRTFKDNKGRSWNVEINISAVKRLKSMLNVNIMDAVEGELLEKLAIDPVLLCDVIYVVCKLDADRQNISDEQFGEAMGGDAIEKATEALLQELVDFFPEAKRRVLRKALEKFRIAESKAIETAENYLDSPAMEKELEKALKSFMPSSGNSQE